MRISSKLTSVVATIFLAIGTIGLLAVWRIQEVHKTTVVSHAKNMAAAMATVAAASLDRQARPEAPMSYQDILDFINAREKRDVEIFGPDLTILADVDAADIGTKVEDGPRRTAVASTLRDGVPRTMTEAATVDSPEMQQVVVPIYNSAHKVIAALAYEYTPLYAELHEEAAHSLRVIGILAASGLALAICCALYISRAISTPLAQLSEAALQLSRGKRGVMVQRHSHDEIGELATAFNTMSAALHLRERAIESSFNAIMIASLTQPGSPIVYANRAFSRITGYSADEAHGRAVDFLVGADSEQPALQELRVALRERREGHAVLRSYRKDGTPFWNEVYLAPVRNDEGPPEHFIAIFNDITEARNDAEQVARQAHFDPLTGLANRSLLIDRIGQAVANAGRHEDSIAVAFIDLDDFKLVNDNLGHECGDELLQVIASRLQSCVRASDTVARLGGDEFVLLLLNQSRHSEITLEAHLTELVRKVLGSIVQPMVLAEQDVRVSCSIGVATFPQDGQDAETLLKNADTAMYRAKELGRNGFQFFTAELQERARKQLELGASLRQALERDEFELHYQPQVSLRSGKVVGMEALLRWRHPHKGLLGPGHFIAFAEESGLILPIGEWVMQQACRQNKAWQDAGLPQVPVAVNVSAKQCAQQDLEGAVRQALHASGLAPQFLELELTESLSMADPEMSVPLMERMKQIGVELSIDDFGTGYSNMSYLKRFPVDRLKLDLSFVRDITTDPGSLAISDAIITMAHSLHLEVVAEGVETDGQLTLLAGRNCDIIQGYYFSKPLAATEMEHLLRSGKCLPDALTLRSSNAPSLLVLDDDPHLLEYLELVLATEGYTVHGTTDPHHAFELLACHDIAVVLCDQRMPMMNGVEFLSRVRRMYPDALRIMLSAYDDYNATRQAINMGAVYKFIEKPLQPEELKQVVDEAYSAFLDGRQLKSA